MMKILNWCRSNPRIAAFSALIAIVVVGGAIVVLTSGGDKKAKASPPSTLSKNPAVANYERQLPALAAAVQKRPDDAKALRAYGIALYATGDVSSARQQYQAELKVNPSDPVLLNNLGNVYRDLGAYDKALQFYQRSISRDAKSLTAYVNLANLYQYTLHQQKLGIKTLQEARRNLPDSTDLGVLLGIAYEQSHNRTDARTAFEQVLRQDPKNAAALAGVKRLGA